VNWSTSTVSRILGILCSWLARFSLTWDCTSHTSILVILIRPDLSITIQDAHIVAPLVVGPFAQLIGVSDSVHPYLLSIINGSSFVGRIIGGQLADRYGRLNVLFPATLIAGVLVLAMWLPAQGSAPLIVFACLYGIMSGVHISVCPAVIGNFSPTDRLGARIGTFFAGISVATLIGTPLGGAFLRHGIVAEYHNLAIFAGVMIVAGAVIIGVARLLCARDFKAKW